MFDVPGYNDDEEQRRRLLQGLVAGPDPSMEPQPVAQSAQMQLRAPDMAPPVGGGAPGMGYTPPPAASTPNYMQHVGGRDFGFGDVAMLGGILAALIGKRPDIAGAIGGQYGGAIMQDSQRRDARNAEIDQYNAQLDERDSPLERWKADMAAQGQFGNLQARNATLDLERQREARLVAEAEAAENPDSAANTSAVEQARRLAQARSDVSIDEAEKRSKIAVSQQDMLAQLLRKGRYAAPTGKGGGGSADPVKALKRAEAAAKLKGIEAGTFDPVTGKPVVPDDVEVDPATGKPYTAAALEKKRRSESLQTAIPGTEVVNAEAWAASSGTQASRDKVAKYVTGVQQVRNALQRMKKLRQAHGTEVLGQAKGAYDAAQLAAIGGFTQIGQSGVLNAGEFERYKELIPGMGPHLNDVSRAFGGSDPTLDKLDGTLQEVNALAADGLGVAGLRFSEGKGAGGGAGQGTGSGTRLYTITTPTGQTGQRELTEEQANALRLKGFKLQ